MDRYKNFILFAVPAYAIYVVCKNIHKICKQKKAVVFDSRRALPCYLYLYLRYKIQAFRKCRGKLYPHRDRNETIPTFTILKCRFNVDDLRWYCWASGYGWDYPDSVFRDIPLCFCDVLCCRLLAMVISSDDFRLSPQGLLTVRHTIRKYQPIDELKKASFCLQAGVSEYRPVDSGVEVDIWLKDSKADDSIWESVVTMLSPRGSSAFNIPLQASGSDAVDENSLEIRVPVFTGLKSAWAFSDVSLKNLLVLPSRLGIVGCSTVHSLWMVSQCLAEIEKHKGAEAVGAPLTLSVQFKQPLLLPEKVIINFWQANDEDRQQPRNVCRFQLRDYRTGTSYISGEMIRELD